MSIIQIDLRASKSLTVLLLSIHMGAITVLCWVPIPIWIKLIAITFCLWDLTRLLRLHIFRNTALAIIKFTINSEQQWWLIDYQGQSHLASLQGNSFMTAYLIILNFKINGSRVKKSVVIARDSVDRDSFRRLSVHLRFYQQFA